MNEQPIFRSRAGLVAIAIMGLLVAVGLVQSAPQDTPEAGPPGSSYSTGRSGTAALASLLEEQGYSVVQARAPLAERPPGTGEVIILVNGEALSIDDRRVLRDHVAEGGRLVAAGSVLLDGVVTEPAHDVTPTRKPARGLLPFGGYNQIGETGADVVWRQPGSMLPLVGNADGTLVAAETVGGGTVVAIADETVLSNKALAMSDNALLALLAVGEARTTVRFLEYPHGFDQPSGLAGLPTRWKQALIVLVVAGLVWLLASARRLGPPEREERELSPPRAAYVDALSVTLAASRDGSATAPLTDAIRRELARRGADVESSDSLLTVATASGVDLDAARQALGDGTGERDAMARATVLAQIVNKEQL